MLCFRERIHSLALALFRLPRALDRVNDRIERLKNRIEDEAVTESHDRASRAFQGAVAIGSITPAVRAVRMAIGAVRSATTVARAVSAGDSLTSALITAGAVAIPGIEFLKRQIPADSLKVPKKMWKLFCKTLIKPTTSFNAFSLEWSVRDVHHHRSNLR